jgi:hypothetical protein
MDYNKIKVLLEKYWNCETTLEEESLLQNYLSGTDIPEDLKEFTPLFQYYKSQRAMKVSEGFEDRVIDDIQSKEKKGKHKYLHIYYKVAAAVILILFFVTIHQRFIAVREKATVMVQDTFENPEKALEETKKALLLVSEKWNKGKDNIAKLSEFNKAEKIIKNEKL